MTDFEQAVKMDSLISKLQRPGYDLQKEQTIQEAIVVLQQLDVERDELLDRLGAEESEVIEQARLNGIGAERELALMAKLEAAEKEVERMKQTIEAQQIAYREMVKDYQFAANKIDEIEKQKPVAWMGRGPRDGRIEFSVDKPSPSVMRDFNVIPLYALPGAKGE